MDEIFMNIIGCILVFMLAMGAILCVLLMWKVIKDILKDDWVE